MQKEVRPQFGICTTHDTSIWGQSVERPVLLEHVICVNLVKNKNPNKNNMLWKCKPLSALAPNMCIMNSLDSELGPHFLHCPMVKSI